MKSIASILLVAFIASALAFTVVADCTPETCPQTGIVVAHTYESSPDCTGNASITPVANISGQSCLPGGSSSYNQSTGYSCSMSEGFRVSTYSGVLDCAPSAFLVATGYGVGVCTRTGNTSSMVVWCSVEDSQKHSARKPVTAQVGPAVPTMPSRYCNDTTGCANNTGTLTEYSDGNCSAETASNSQYPFYNQLQRGTPEGDTCYYYSTESGASYNYDGAFNAQAICTNDAYSLTLGRGCGSDMAVFTSYSIRAHTCIQTSATAWVRLNCTVSPNAPGNGASSMTSFSPLFATAIALIALIALF